MTPSHKPIIILGIESSCDDTSASVCIDGQIVSNVIYSQKIHESFGGVVPELASRSHEQKIIPVVQKAIADAGIYKKNLSAIAFTRGPGLIGSLMVGVSFSKALGLALGIPLLEVNHMQAHVLSNLIESPDIVYPFICLTVSGGHTQLVLVRSIFDMEVIGTTIDDAAGEAFDKSAKMLGLEYPGGPMIDKLAKDGDENRFQFSKPSMKDYNYSFSGLKTSILYYLQKKQKENPNFIGEHIHDLCASIQKTIVDILLHKLEAAIAQYPVQTIAIAGGVSANSKFRMEISTFGEKHHLQVFIPSFQYCTDNAAMIAMVGYHKYLKKDFVGQDTEPLVKNYSI